MITAVIFDLGGVVLESPLAAIAGYESQNGIASGSINRVVHERGAGGAWARHERGEIGRDLFLTSLAAECREAGIEVDTVELMDRIEASFRVRPAMVATIRRLRGSGLAVAAITNNWTPFPNGGIRDEFDVFVESVVEGARKPEPAIYLQCLSLLGVEPSSVVMLDDLGPNLKPARELGMATIKVASVHRALSDLEALTGVGLAG